MLYLDHAATTTMRPEALEALDEAHHRFNANASGQHSDARAAKNALEDARERAAGLLGMDQPHGIVFTGSGTEADNLAVIGASLASQRRTVAFSGIEHKAVLNAAGSLKRFGYVLHVLPVTSDGVVDRDAVSLVAGREPALVSVMLANNEVGTLQPLLEIAQQLREQDPQIVLHTDAVQAFSSQEVTFPRTGVDMISLSAHKFGGPKGVGLLAVAPGVTIEPLIHGGGHEAGRRAGTQNVAGIVAMVAAMEAAAQDRAGFTTRVGAERDAFEGVIVAQHRGAVVTAGTAHRLPHISHMRFPGVLAETFLIRLDMSGIAAAAGSACQSGAVEPSHVLTAMGYDDVATGQFVRFSFGWDSAEGDGLRAASVVLDVLRDL